LFVITLLLTIIIILTTAAATTNWSWGQNSNPSKYNII